MITVTRKTIPFEKQDVFGYKLDCILQQMIHAKPKQCCRQSANTALVRTVKRLRVRVRGYLPSHNFTVMPKRKVRSFKKHRKSMITCHTF
ncbi:hypothetical protein PROH_05040 [Prochlorothrix hollandica PCC 9006 = CALU 1027]|uniref:Uncharacterized protein n=1 Tax=Prochlorothrix hollandica PCC 9006 = CALU 1027 TaxID=317619 RepID=A0A0M2Q126_PROHO|nr:hypothetical protein PROH_05040 [Prochlorothrix hollandica PCC 9006 = CALU 1027]